MRTLTGVLAGSALAVALAVPAYGQGIDLGLRAGMNLAKIAGDEATIDGVEPSNRSGFTVGAFARLGIAPSFAIQPEVLYSQKGADYEEQGATITFDLGYVDVPVLAVFSPPAGGAMAFRPVLMAGPVLSFRTGCEVTGQMEGVSATVDCNDFGAELKGTDIGLLFGGGAGMGLGPGMLHVDARYGMGLTSVDDSGDAADMKNRLISLTVGYSFHLGR